MKKIKYIICITQVKAAKIYLTFTSVMPEQKNL